MRYFREQLKRVWQEPRKLIVSVLRRRSKNFFHPIILLTALFAMIDQSLQLLEIEGGLREALPVLIVLVLTVPLIYAGVWFNAGLLAICGGWLGGKGDMNDLRSAVVYAMLPVLCMYPVALLLAYLGQLVPALVPLAVGIKVAQSLVGLVFLVTLIAEVHEFSMGKAIAANVIAIVLVIAAVAGLVAIFSLLPPILVL